MKNVDYSELCQGIRALTEGVPYLTANLANTSALIWQTMEGLNWAGFYQMTDGALVLGPFQGKPACIRIQVGKGVCGTAVQERRTIRVEDVHEFPGHIACSSTTRSEIVVPVFGADQRLIGVLDIDSNQPDAFTADDQSALEGMLKDVFGKL